MKFYVKVIVFTSILIGFLFFLQAEWKWSTWLVSAFSILFSLSGFFIAVVIFLENRTPTKTLTWLLVLAVFPVVGFFFYILFGRNIRKKRLFYKKREVDEEAYAFIEGNKSLNNEMISHLSAGERKVINLAHHLSKSPITFNTDTKVLTNGEETYASIIHALNDAKKHIHMEYYIVRDDTIGTQIKEILIKKANEGLEVRFLYDAVGSWKLSKSYIEDLKQNGVEVVAFAPVSLPFITHKANFRNHRKIIVIDSEIAFVGGLNIGDEYLGKNDYYGLWRDTHLWTKGEAVNTLQLIFLQDWYYMTGNELLSNKYLKKSDYVKVPKKNFGGVQMIAGGPDNEWETLKLLFFAMIASAKNSICISTPYFIPDEDIFSALKVAALSGIEVNILVPDRPDKKTVFYASRSYFPELLEAGVNIYEYKKGFLHSKVVIVDGTLASIGTANMDLRSFHLNFEVNAFLYQSDSIKSLAKDFQHDLKNAVMITENTFNKRPVWMKIVESLARLLSPLL